MSNREELIDEVVALLKIWATINSRPGASHWPAAAGVLGERINRLCEEIGPEAPLAELK